MLLGVLLIAGAVFLLVHNRQEDQLSGAAADAVLQQLQMVISEAQQEKEPDDETVPPQELPGATRPALPQIQIDGQDYMGVLSIPSINLQLPIISQWSDAALRTAPCRHVGSLEEDNLVIAGHNYSKHFGQLDQLKTGDLVVFADLTGQTYLYEVVELERMPGTAIEQMLDSGHALTLYTCTYGGQDRIAVRCNRK